MDIYMDLLFGDFRISAGRGPFSYFFPQIIHTCYLTPYLTFKVEDREQPPTCEDRRRHSLH